MCVKVYCSEYTVIVCNCVRTQEIQLSIQPRLSFTRDNMYILYFHAIGLNRCKNIAHIFSYTIDLDYVPLETKSADARYTIAGYWMPKNNEIKAGLDKIDISRLGSNWAYRYLIRDIIHAVSFTEMVSIHY
jgi:hypothetical protein